MRASVQKSCRWLANLAQRSVPANRHCTVARRMLGAELLESRNAPGVMLPASAALTSFSDGGEYTDPLFEESQRIETRMSDRSAAIATSIEPLFSAEDFVDALRETESLSQQNQSQLETARQATEFRTPFDLAAVNSAFESFTAYRIETLMFLADSFMPPPVIHPVEPPTEEPQEISLPTVGMPLETPSGDVGSTVPLTPQLPEEIPPPVIQPVIMDPDSEHNQPN
jgi:hypothetical protein